MAVENTFERLFTVEEANEILPLIRAKVSRMKDVLIRVRGVVEKAARETNLPPWSPELSRKLSEGGVAPELMQEITALVDEVNSHGCLVKGPESGLVDFPCLLGTEIVFLCWQLGEPRVSHWHRIPDGFAGRHPLLDADLESGAVN